MSCSNWNILFNLIVAIDNPDGSWPSFNFVNMFYTRHNSDACRDVYPLILCCWCAHLLRTQRLNKIPDVSPKQFNPYTPVWRREYCILTLQTWSPFSVNALAKKKLINSSSITSPVKTQQAFWAMFAAALLIQGTQENKRVFGKGPFHAGLENCWPSLCWSEAQME